MLSRAGVDLMNAFLTFDPDRRISAKEALQHPWFSEHPLPQNPKRRSMMASSGGARRPMTRHRKADRGSAHDASCLPRFMFSSTHVLQARRRRCWRSPCRARTVHSRRRCSLRRAVRGLRRCKAATAVMLPNSVNDGDDPM